LDLETAQNFAAKKQALQDEMSLVKPKENNPEKMSPGDWLNNLGMRIQGLHDNRRSARAGVTSTKILFDDGSTGVDIRTGIETDQGLVEVQLTCRVRNYGYQGNPYDQFAKVTAAWTFQDGSTVREQYDLIRNQHYSFPEKFRVLGLIDESVTVFEQAVAA
jgi:hypothetical protein